MSAVDLEEVPETQKKALTIEQHRRVFPLLDRDFAAGIGYVCSEWAFVEDQLAHVMGFLLGMEGRGIEAVTRGLQIQARIDLASSLIQLVGNDALSAQWREVKALIEKSRTKRNEVIHSVWAAAGKCGQIQGRSVRGNVRIVRGTVTTADLHALFDDLTYLVDRIARLAKFMIAANAAEKLKESSPPGFDPAQHILSHSLKA